MGWKIVRDNDETVCPAMGVSGQWRPCATPVLSLTKKLCEEVGEWAESGDADELYDLADVLNRLIRLADPHGDEMPKHAAKVAERGGFDRLIEWTPVPTQPGVTGEHHVTFTDTVFGVEHPADCPTPCAYQAAVRRIIGCGSPIAGRWRITGIDADGLPDLESADGDGGGVDG